MLNHTNACHENLRNLDFDIDLYFLPKMSKSYYYFHKDMLKGNYFLQLFKHKTK